MLIKKDNMSNNSSHSVADNSSPGRHGDTSISSTQTDNSPGRLSPTNSNASDIVAEPNSNLYNSEAANNETYTLSPTLSQDTLSSQANAGCLTYTLNSTSDLYGRDEFLSLDNGQDCVTIIHFNDCYNIEPSIKSSGAAGFLTAINLHRHLNPMILFSGDIISPSFMSTFTKGEQMIPVLNDIQVDCAVFGNHEFDYGVDNLIEFVKRTTFPWLLSNVIDKETSNQLGDGQVFHIIERSGFKFGLIGLIEEEWLSTLSTLDSSDVIYEDFVDRGRELARWLKSAPNYVDFVIALTHFRTPNDVRLADSVPEIDLILGGHDHDYEIIKRPNCYIIKSGTDFREFSKISLKVNPEYLEMKRKLGAELSQRANGLTTGDWRRLADELGKPFLDFNIEHIECVDFEPDEGLKQKLDKFVSTIDEKMYKVLGQFNCELDGTFSSIRKSETNLGNFVTDIMLASTHADLAILNSGTLRSDRIHPKGDFTMRDLFNILGYIDPIAVLKASGYHIWKALENGVSQWPKLEGRFPQVSGCTFLFDPNRPPMQRIDPKNITIGDEPLVLDKHYRLTTKAYLASGKDGYDMLKECEILVPGDESPDLTTSILNHFEAISIVKSNRRTHHRQSIICVSRASLQKILDQTSNSINLPIESGGGGNAQPAIAPFFSSTLDHSSSASFDVNETPALTPVGGEISWPPNDGNNNLNISRQSNNEGQSAADDQLGASLTDISTGIHNMSHISHKRLSVATSSSPLAGAIVPVSSPSGLASPVVQPIRTKRIMSLFEIEHEQCKLEPKIEGRIKILGVNA